MHSLIPTKNKPTLRSNANFAHIYNFLMFRLYNLIRRLGSIPQMVAFPFPPQVELTGHGVDSREVLSY